MRILIFILLFPLFASAQDSLVKVGMGEYSTGYLSSTGRFYHTVWGGDYGVSRDTTVKLNLRNVTDIDGAQYFTIGIADDTVFVAGKCNPCGGGPIITKYPTDSNGVRFSGATKVYGWFQTFLALKNDSIYYWGADSANYGSLKLGGVTNIGITKPFKLGQPTGRQISKVVIGDQDVPSFIVLCTDGSVWTYTQGGGGVPVQKSGVSSVLDIGGISRNCFVAATASDILAWGQFTEYVNLPTNTTTPTSILSQFTTAGLRMPLKNIGNSSNILALIDADDSLFVLGDTPQGEGGNGQEVNPYRTYKAGTFSGPFSWDFLRGQKLISTPYKFRGRFKNLQTGGQIGHYIWVQDLHSNWYSWGRAKAYALGNGSEIQNMNDYPNFRDVPAPLSVAPLAGLRWPSGGGPTFNPNDSLPPIANAGVDRDVLTSQDSLYGDLSSQQEHSIVGYAWTQTGGPNTATILAPASANTAITGLIDGTYTFQVLVTNHDGQTNTDTVTLYVDVPAQSGPRRFNGLRKFRRL
jgi:hypothetical protein